MRIPARIFYAFTAVLSIWVFCFYSGLIPYLGSGKVNDYAGPGFSSALGSFSIGTKTMLLLKGQNAFIEYRSTSPQSEMAFDVKPLTTLGFSDRMQRIHGTGSGRVEFPIQKSGIYRFRTRPAPARSFGRSAYTVSWGAN